MTTIVSSLVPVLLLFVAVNAAPVREGSASSYFYEPIVPYGPYPAPGYVVSTYLPKYTSYQVVSSVPYPPRKTEYDEDNKYDEEEPKYYYGGKFRGVCSIDGLYYVDEMSYVVCSNGYASRQPCPPGTKTDKFPSYKAGYYYGSSDLCTVNLVDVGYGPHSYVPQRGSYEEKVPNSYEEKPATSYGADEPRKDRPTYRPSDNSYNSPQDPYSATYDNSAGSSYHAVPSYPPQNSYQPPDYSSQNSYVVDQPHESYSTSIGSSYHSPPSHRGSYPPKQDSYSSQDSYKPSPPYPPRDVYTSSDSDQYYKPSPSYYAYPAKPTSYEDTGAGYPSKDGH